MRKLLARLTLTTVLVASAGTAAVVTAADSANAASCSNGYVALTYDDGPNTTSTQALLNQLAAAGAKATFFIWGAHAQQYPSLLQAEANAGMWIANHTWDHPHMTQLSTANMTSEISQTQNIIKQTIGQTPVLFRPPYGETNSTLKSVEASFGLTEIIWNQDSQDWNGASTASIVATAATMKSGDVILMHDGGYQTTINAVSQIVSGLTSRGLCPGMISPSTGRAVAPNGTVTTTTRTTTSTTTTRTSTTTTTRSTTPVTSTTGGTGTGSCSAAYSVTSSWSGGFVASVTVTAGSAGTNSWKVTVNLPSGASISSLWNGTASGSSGSVTVTDAGYNGKLSAGQSTSFGFQGSGNGSGASVSCAAG